MKNIIIYSLVQFLSMFRYLFQLTAVFDFWKVKDLYSEFALQEDD